MLRKSIELTTFKVVNSYDPEKEEIKKKSEVKVLVVGKSLQIASDFCKKLVHGEFSSHYKKIIGIDFLNLRTEEATFQLWDISMASHSRILLPSYCKNTRIVILLADNLTDLKSNYENIKKAVNTPKENNEICYCFVTSNLDLHQHPDVQSFLHQNKLTSFYCKEEQIHEKMPNVLIKMHKKMHKEDKASVFPHRM